MKHIRHPALQEKFGFKIGDEVNLVVLKSFDKPGIVQGFVGVRVAVCWPPFQPGLALDNYHHWLPDELRHVTPRKPSPAQKQIVIDHLAAVLRKPTASPIMTPGEVIAIALNGTQWIPGRPVQDGDNVIFQTLRLLRQAGYAIVPATREDDDSASTSPPSGREGR